MNCRFVILFAVTITFAALTMRAGEAALADGGALASLAFLLLGGLALLGLVALLRFVYLDGLANARRREGRSTSRRHLSMLLSAAAVVASLLAAGPAFAHGDEGQALAEVPARTLVQQALGLLTQTEEPAEAMERLEAALGSQDTEGVDLASVRDALGALERGDHEEAIVHLSEALAPAEEPAQPTEEPAGGHEEGAAPAEQAPPPSEEALSHTEEFEPDRGTAEWVGVAVGVFLIAVALGLLATRRRATAA